MTAAPPTRRRRRRWLRWLVGLVATVLILLILIVVTVQIVLGTTLPKRLVLGQLQTAFGLRVEAESMSVGWLGHTTLKNVTLSLPLAAQSLLDVPQMDVEHTNLPMIALTRGVKLESATFRRPTLVVVQNSAGQWNVAEALQLVARAAGSKNTDQQAQQRKGVPELPAINVIDGTVKVTDRAGKTAQVSPLQVHGEPVGALVWKYDASVESRFKVEGRVAPGGAWEHEVAFAVQNLGPYLKPWMDQPPRILTRGEWRGRVDNGSFGGRVTFDQLSVGTISATGAASVNRDASGTVNVRPVAGFMIKSPQKLVQDVTIGGGAVALTPTTVRAVDLLLRTGGGEAQVTGDYTWGDHSGNLNAAWRDVQLPKGVTHNGSATASLRMPWPGAPRIEATVNSLGETEPGTWDAELQITGDGRSWSDVDWTVKAPHLIYSGKQRVPLYDVVARATTRGRVITLNELTFAGSGHVGGRGEMNLDQHQWWLWFGGQDYVPANARVFHDLGDVPLSFDVGAWGKWDELAMYTSLNNASLRAGDLEVWLGGFYDGHLPKPVDAYVTVWKRPPHERTMENPLILGQFRADAKLTGTLWPEDVQIEGKLDAKNLVFNNHPLGDADVRLTGYVHPRDSEISTVDDAQLLDGRWRFRAFWPVRDRSGNPFGARVVMSVHDLPVQSVLAAATPGVPVTNVNVPTTTPSPSPSPSPTTAPATTTTTNTTAAAAAATSAPSTGSAVAPGPVAQRIGGVATEVNLTADLPFPGFNIDRIQAQGNVEIRDLEWDTLAAQRASAQFNLDEGRVEIQPVVLTQDKGRTTISAQTSLRRLKQWQVTAAVASWPYSAGGDGGATAEVTANTNLSLDLDRFRFSGPLNARADLTFRNQPLGKATLRAQADGRSVEITQFNTTLLDGSAQGTGTILLDRPNASTMQVAWRNFDIARVGAFFPGSKSLEGVTGRFSGSALLAPSDDPRALEPLRLDVSIQSQQAKFRAIDIGDSSLVAFLHLPERPRVIEAAERATDVQSRGGRTNFPEPPPPQVVARTAYEGWRFVMDDSTFNVADGVVRVWARADAHNREASSLQLHFDLQKLDLNQIVQAFKPEPQKTPGRISGAFTLVGSGQGGSLISLLDEQQRRQRVFGDGRVKLTQSDLKGTRVVGFLYNAMHLDMEGNVPTGTGAASLRLENDMLLVNSFVYFNRGTEVRATAVVKDVWDIPDCPIDGTAFGSLRPLRSIKLPLFAEADKAFAAIQKEAVTVEIKGSVREPTPKLIPFAAIGEQFRAALLGGAKGNDDTGEAMGE